MPSTISRSSVFNAVFMADVHRRQQFLAGQNRPMRAEMIAGAG